MQLYEKYRPRTFADFIGQDKIVNRLNMLMNRPSWDRDAFWIQGPSGTGKTTLAWIIARQMAGNDFNVIEYDGHQINKGAMADIERDICFSPMFDGWKVYIVNEAHNMTASAVQSWLTLLERLPARRLIIFTTTEILQDELFGNFSPPFASRCKVFTFTNQGLAQSMAHRARQIAQAEGLDGQPEAKYLRLVQDCRNNMRAVLQRIDGGEMLA